MDFRVTRNLSATADKQITDNTMQKLYCYVDETGQDTQGGQFFVAAVVVEENRDEVDNQLQELERTAAKGWRKWIKATDEQQLAYIKGVLALPTLKGALMYGAYFNTLEYLPSTVLTTARAITTRVRGDYKAIVLVDGLQQVQVQWFANELRHLHIRTKKIRGIRNEEANALMRLADAIAGFVRDANTGKEALRIVLEQAKQDGYIKEI
jgi:hypothetical protein